MRSLPPPNRTPGPGRWRPGRLLLGGAVALACRALAEQRRARQAERDHPPAGRFVTVEGVRLHHVERGEGCPVVLIHGNGGMVEDFALSGVLDLAAGKYRTIAFDRPGSGHSSRPRERAWTVEAQAALIMEALRQMDARHPIVVGHSLGALVALAMGLQAPREVAGLVLLAGYYFPTFRIDALLVSATALPVIGHALRHAVLPGSGRLAAPHLVRKVFAPAPVPDGFRAFPMALALRPSQIGAVAADTAYLIPAAAALSRRYRELRLPVVILTGSDDRIVAAAQSRRLHRRIAGSELRLFEGVGHMVHHAAPAAVVDAVDLVAGRTQAGPAAS